ncbi:sigma factor-like helix-turn-helix DNA-binding protein [Paraburkholderia phenazinium]|uniref:Helix-turn-helix n=1 Tax=Paraburkholderia phenazinium TaxID=60549 RepID=A0A1N6KTH3_9BURK|nr:sigma factor-like helix-turn-helix DNA-binding protein [Paraburkholderia phenazinium]SIO59841.1 Helix-turn-helix [Paraburkholderia phenazinium]
MKPVPSPVLQADEVRQQLTELARQLTTDPEIARFSLAVDNRTGMVSANVQHWSGRIQHDEWIARDLRQSQQSDPASLTICERNRSVLSLLNQGITQVEVAKRIGISQSRVAQIKKSSM